MSQPLTRTFIPRTTKDVGPNLARTLAAADAFWGHCNFEETPIGAASPGPLTSVRELGTPPLVNCGSARAFSVSRFVAL